MDRQHKRGQAALEFLLTYSWAILVVIVIIGALAYFGVLNPANFIPESCKLTAGMACDDYIYTEDATASPPEGTFQIQVTNGLGRAINVSSVNFSGQDVTNGNACGNVSNVIIPNGGSALLSVEDDPDCYAVAGLEKVRAVVEILYTYTGSQITEEKRISGEVFVNTQR